VRRRKGKKEENLFLHFHSMTHLLERKATEITYVEILYTPVTTAQALKGIE
jgi:hypothetical protein